MSGWAPVLVPDVVGMQGQLFVIKLAIEIEAQRAVVVDPRR